MRAARLPFQHQKGLITIISSISSVDPNRAQPHQLGGNIDTTHMDPPDLPAVAVLVKALRPPTGEVRPKTAWTGQITTKARSRPGQGCNQSKNRNKEVRDGRLPGKIQFKQGRLAVHLRKPS